MYKVLSKDTIELEIVPYIPVGKRGFKSKVPLCEIINCILYKLKTGIQWYLLPILQLFSKEVLHYKTVFGYYRKWCKAGIWKACWSGILQKNKSKIDLSSGPVEMQMAATQQPYGVVKRLAIRAGKNGKRSMLYI